MGSRKGKMMHESRKPRLLIGAHMSIAGGLHLAVERGAEAGCAVVQLFTKNATQWRERAPDAEEARLLREAMRAAGIGPVFSHAGYLINLASSRADLWEKSVAALAAEVERCRLLGLPFTVVHPGSHGGDGEEAGLARVAAGLREVITRTPGAPVRVVLENTAGQGHSLGHRFEHLAGLLDAAGYAERLGVCFDTCHAFAAGYDLRTPEAYRETMKELHGTVGIERVFALHLNDARKELGSRVDRHEHIGRGAIGREGFRLLMQDEAFGRLPKVLETPKLLGAVAMDPVNLALLRELAG
jgi:deoxyribonuclease-4